MRPVNLIPPEQRRGERAPSRTGPAAYVIVAMLAVALGAVTLTVLTNNKVADRQSEVATLEAEETAATAEANRLSSYAEFASLQLTREQTVSTLARSRFDWERVLRELAIVIPGDIQLTNVTGTVAPGVELAESAGNSLRSEIAGPALEITGCAPGHESVAALAAALEDIDGVTRVAVNNSDRSSEGGDSGAGSTGDGGGCETTKDISQFAMVAAFDAVAVPAATPTEAAPSTEVAGEESSEAPSEPTSSETPTGDSEAVADAEAQEQQARDSSAEQTDKARNAAGLIPGTVR